jgi:hypothetical protein
MPQLITQATAIPEPTCAAPDGPGAKAGTRMRAGRSYLP